MKARAILNITYCLLSINLFGQSISIDNIKAHIKYLSSDKLKGRGTGSPEEILAANYIAKSFEKLKLVPKGDNNSYLYSYSFKKSKSPKDTVEKVTVNGYNVAAYLDNGEENTVVFGAHYDHLGMGHDHNSREGNPEGKIHNGADDNASGTAGVLELAKYFANNNRKEKFNFLFICFSGEELGLQGSKKYCSSPTVDLSKVNYMINMDMIGRLHDSLNSSGKTGKLIIYGVGTAPEWVPIIEKLSTDLVVKKDSAGVGPSDQTSFYLKNIPVLHFFTGQHMDYHKASDDYEKINFEGEKKVLEYIIAITEETEKLPKLNFQKTRTPEMGRSAGKVTLGIMPDYGFEGKGVRADGIISGRTAENAGIKAGDIIIQIGDSAVNSLPEYMKVLSGFKKNDNAIVTILRDGKEMKVQVTF